MKYPMHYVGWLLSALLVGILSTGCSGSAGRNDAAVSAPLPVSVTLSADPATVVSGGTATLTWTSNNAVGCTASGNWSGVRPVSGTEVTSPITVAATYTLTCTGAGGMAAATANVAVATTPTVTISATPSLVASGATTTLMWSSTDATSCTASGGWSGTRPTVGTEVTAPLSMATAYTLTCTGPGGSAAATVNVAIMSAAAPAPTIALTAAPSALRSGNGTTLTWTSTDTTGCTASGGWTGPRATSGNEVQPGVTTATVYTLSCNGPGGTAAASANVSIAPMPTVTISATPASVVSGAATTLMWFSTNATSCVASGSWNGARGTSGSEMLTNLTLASAFTLTCSGAGGTAAATANVSVLPATPQPTVTITANPLSVASGGTTTLMWSTTSATACTASGSWTGPKSTAGSEARTITATSSFTLTCTGAGGSGAATVNVALAQAAGSYSTTFPLTENPLSEGGAWSRMTSQGFTNVRTEGNAAFGTNGAANAFDDSYALLRGNFGRNQTASAVIRRSANLNTSVTHEVELLLRFTDDSITARGYECLFSFSGGVQIIRWDGLNLGSMNFAVLPVENNRTFGPLQTNDVIRASINGDLISLSINGNEVGRARDSTYSSGQPGIGFFTRPNGNSQNLAITSYQVTSTN